MQNKLILQSDHNSNLDSDINDSPDVEKKDNFDSNNKDIDNDIPDSNLEYDNTKKAKEAGTNLDNKVSKLSKEEICEQKKYIYLILQLKKEKEDLEN